jgi:hypothetical protein
MVQKLQIFFLSLAMVLGVGVVTVAPVEAVNVFKGVNKDETCPPDSKNAVCASTDDKINEPVQDVINTLLMAIGIISVIMIIIGGIRYTISNGDASKINSAKDTILYAVVGLVIALLAYVIVGFVVDQFK